MKNKLRFLGLACASLILVGGCGEIPTLSDGTEAVVTFDGIDGISADSLYSILKESYGIEALLTMIDKQVYETEFPDELENAAEYAETYTNYYMSMYESEDEFLAALNGSFNSIDSYKDYLYNAYFQNIAIDTYSKSLITDDQIEKYYNEEYYADVELAHILITSSVSSTATSEEVTEAEELAESTAKEIITLLNIAKTEGKDIEEYFAELAIEYSEDSSNSSTGGNIGVINYIDFNYSYDEFVDMAISLNDGEYSSSVVETELGFHIILKIETKDKNSLSDATDIIRETLSNNNLAIDYTIIYDAITSYREKYGFDITDSELANDYKEYMKNYEEYLISYYTY